MFLCFYPSLPDTNEETVKFACTLKHHQLTLEELQNSKPCKLSASLNGHCFLQQIPTSFCQLHLSYQMERPTVTRRLNQSVPKTTTKKHEASLHH